MRRHNGYGIGSIMHLITHNLATLFLKKRKELGISIRELNKVTGVSTAVISDFENELYLPMTDGLARLAICLNITIQQIFEALTPVEMTLSSKGVKNDLDNVLTCMGLSRSQKSHVESYIEFLKGAKWKL